MEGDGILRESVPPVVILTLLSLLIYGQVVGFGVIDIWDDARYFLSRELLDGWFAASWYERLATPEIGYPGPIPAFLYFLLHQLPADLIVPAAHAVNLAFHLFNVVLVYAIAKVWLSNRQWAMAVAAVWAAHPVLVESVAWITNLKSLGVCSALLGAVLLSERYARTEEAILLPLLGVLFVVGLGFKPTAVVFVPVIIAVIALRSPQLLKRRSLIAFSLVSGAITVAYLKFAAGMHRGQVGESSGFDVGYNGMFEMVERSGAAFFVQVRNVVRPLELHPAYYPSEVGSFQSMLGVGVLLLIGLATVWAIRNCRSAAMGLSFFWITYAPHSGLEFLPRFTADTYAYLPLFGLIAGVVGVMKKYRKALFPRYRRAVAIGVVGLVVVLGFMSFFQTSRWANSRTLWEPVAEAYPDVFQPNHMMGIYHFERGEYEEALEYHRQAKAVNPAASRTEIFLPRTLERLGRVQEAFDLTLKNLAADGPTHPQAESYAIWLWTGYGEALSISDSGRRHLLEAVEPGLQRGAFNERELKTLEQRLRDFGEEEMAKRVRKHREEGF